MHGLHGWKHQLKDFWVDWMNDWMIDGINQ